MRVGGRKRVAEVVVVGNLTTFVGVSVCVDLPVCVCLSVLVLVFGENAPNA